MKRKKTFLLILTIILICGCCRFHYDDNDFEFNNSELKHFGPYKKGDTIYFESNKNDIDTIQIMGFDTQRNKNYGCGLMNPKPINCKWVLIKHLPNDNWHGINNQTTIVYQGLLWVLKFPTDKKTKYFINFKDFHSLEDTIIGEYHKDSITLNNFKFCNYYLVKHGYPERVKETKNIELIYWTDKEGLIAYKNKGGEIWTKKRYR